MPCLPPRPSGPTGRPRDDGGLPRQSPGAGAHAWAVADPVPGEFADETLIRRIRAATTCYAIELAYGSGDPRRIAEAAPPVGPDDWPPPDPASPGGRGPMSTLARTCEQLEAALSHVRVLIADAWAAREYQELHRLRLTERRLQRRGRVLARWATGRAA